MKFNYLFILLLIIGTCCKQPKFGKKVTINFNEPICWNEQCSMVLILSLQLQYGGLVLTPVLKITLPPIINNTLL